MTNPVFHWPIRIYYSDTDAGGVVYHANYLNFFEHARTEMLRAAGHEQSHDGQASWMFVVSEMTLKFARPAKLNQQLTVVTEICTARGASLDFVQSLVDEDNNLYCQANVQVVCVDAQTFRPTRIPQPIKQELTRAH
ncbi:tol-pal system-associated acyl-CoA thioesterase [uncultured Ferrimonas sp.]|uniref:tol-pal system-associated acyl-CoA thioesterase n=1 Tax=uncultured Ferrimonas sp. TaxID=432640 RepID=UPI0026304449|nr:tol-pal system-associated acyl-CoA thioesterase [uncultured Ferrimonas sp.]